MRLREGRIGIQESVSVLTLALTGLCVFTLDSKTAYAPGNTTYIWLPAGVLLALLSALLVAYVMRKGDYGDLMQLYYAGLGPVFGRASLLVLAAVLFYQSLKLQTSFINALQSYIFADSQYEPIALWIMLPALYIAWGGLERIGRSAKCVTFLAALSMLIVLVAPAKAFSLFRLFPFPGDPMGKIGIKTLSSTAEALPSLLLALGLCGGMQGRSNAKKSITIAALIAAALVFAVQLALALVFTSTQLQSMYMPLFRIDMTMLPGSYFVRQDKIELFLWIFGAIPALAFLEYGIALLFCKTTGMRDIRPALLSVFLWMLFCQLWLNSGFYASYESALRWMDAYGFIPVYAPLIAALIIAALAAKKKVAA